MRVLAICITSLLVCGVHFACKQRVNTARTYDAASGPSTGWPATSGDRILYHGLELSPDLVVLNDPTPSTMDGAPGTEGQTAFALAAGDTPYMARCRQAGVPIPPPWGDARWKSMGELDQGKLFAGTGRTVLYSYSEPGGICTALPRYTDDGSINLFGQICVNLKTGDTCFWDNTKGAGRVPVKAGYSVANVQGADQLAENCTKCHRGENPWVVIPGQPLENLPLPENGGYRPIGAPQWQNPVATESVGACESCHTIPKLSPEYCTIGLGMISKGVMPDGGGTDGVREFQKACRSPSN